MTMKYVLSADPEAITALVSQQIKPLDRNMVVCVKVQLRLHIILLHASGYIKLP